MFTWSVFDFWLAQILLVLAGFGQSHLESQRMSRGWTGFLMMLILVASIIGFWWNPGMPAILGNCLWSLIVLVIFVQRTHGLRGITSLTTFTLAVMRHFDPLNPHQVTMVNWPILESVLPGLLIGIIAKDPLWSALSTAVITSQSSTVLSVLTGHLHFRTARDLSFSVAATMIAWYTSWTTRSILSLWRML